MAAYCWVYDSVQLQAECQEPGSAAEPYARQSSTGYLFISIGVSTQSSTVALYYLYQKKNLTTVLQLSYDNATVMIYLQ